MIGIPSAFMLHGYVGFIFGSIKANPWWSTPLMPIVFLFSAIVSGIAAVMLIYMATCKLRKVKIDMLCVDTIAKYLFYAFIVDFTLEMLDLIHRLYEADESLLALDFMVKTRLFTSQIVLQIILGTLVPLAMLFAIQLMKFSENARKRMYVTSGLLTLTVPPSCHAQSAPCVPKVGLSGAPSTSTWNLPGAPVAFHRATQSIVRTHTRHVPACERFTVVVASFTGSPRP